MKTRTPNSKTQGFMLLVVVLMILGLTMGVGIWLVSGKWLREEENITLTRTKMKQINDAISFGSIQDRKGYAEHVGYMPAALNDLITKPGGDASCSTSASTKMMTGWCGPYWTNPYTGMSSWADAWGTTITYSASAMTLTSYGPNRVSGGGDDIVHYIDLLPPNHAGLYIHWSFEEASGNRTDTGPSGVTLMEVGGALGNATGKIGNAFNNPTALGRYLGVSPNNSVRGTSLDFSKQSFTTTAWYSTTNSATSSGMWHRGNCGNGTQTFYDWTMWYWGSHGFYGTMSDGTTVCVVDTFTVSATNTWSFVVLWYDNSAGTFNAQANNGTAGSTACSTGFTNTNVSSSWFCVGRSNDWLMTGSLDELSVWGRVLTSTERASLYNAGRGREYPFK